MITIAYEDRANPGYFRVPKSASLTMANRHDRIDRILKDLKGLGNCRIYRIQIRGDRVVKQRMIAERGFE